MTTAERHLKLFGHDYEPGEKGNGTRYCKRCNRDRQNAEWKANAEYREAHKAAKKKRADKLRETAALVPGLRRKVRELQRALKGRR